MPTGRLGTADLVAATLTSVYTVPAGFFTVATVSVTNRTNNPISVRLAISTTGTPSNAEYIEWDTEIAGRGVLERTGLVMDAGKQIVVRSSAASVSVMAFGIETSTT